MGTPLLSCSSYRYDGVTLVPRGSPPSTLYHNPTRFTLSYCRKSMVKMSINSPPINSIVLVAVALDFLVTVDSYPKPDDKIRSTTFQVQGGGNTGNAMPCAAHLGLTPRIISKVAGDSQGKRILNELEADGIDTSFIVVSQPHFNQESFCASCTFLLQPTLFAQQDFHRQAIYFSKLPFSVLCCTFWLDFHGSTTWTEAPSISGGLISILLKLPSAKFVIVTLGEDGCIMLERAEAGILCDLFEKMKQSIDTTSTEPTCKTCKTSDVAKLHAKGIGAVCGWLLVGTAEKIPSSELVDTTGAGDAFVGAVLYSLCANFPPEKMLSFAAQVVTLKSRFVWRAENLLLLEIFL
ncbi:uncharacterized protein LOC132637132 [Lycium barbarum]|uniref:uncharacterized protein LOC132637132 n=1 Tax=Lycium barbarum TaxID=112863 RepID=UPI00293F0EA9|nr:uncharacterized protein LOC132637132 [Lycium barbarum]